MSLMLVCVTLLSFSCARVKVPVTDWWADKGELGAQGFNTNGDNLGKLDKHQWDDKRFGMVCTEAENFGAWKAVILKLCKVSNRCTFEDKKKIAVFFNAVNAITAYNPKANDVGLLSDADIAQLAHEIDLAIEEVEARNYE
jgi:hypothetical protein